MRSVYPALTIVLSLSVSPAIATAQTTGMVAADDGSVIIFNADSDTVVTTIPLPGNQVTTGDCSISPDQTRGFVTDFTGRVHVIDLTTSPPSLAPGRNPIRISNPGEDTALSPDGRFLVVCDGAAPAPISVVDVARQKEVGTFNLGPLTDCNAVDVCSDGSVLVSSNNAGRLRRLTIDGAGTLIDTGEVLDVGRYEAGPNNVFCGRGGRSGIVIRRGAANITSFTVPGLEPLDTRTVGRYGISGQVNQAGNRVFIRTTGAGSSIQAFAYDSVTGALGVAPIFSNPVAGVQTFFGIDQLALHPNQTKLYVPEPYTLRIDDPVTGAKIGTVALPGIREPTGVCFAPPQSRFLTYDVKESNGEPRFAQVDVLLDDGLLGRREPFVVEKLEELGSPADVNGQGVSSLDTPLVAYRIQDDLRPEQLRGVRIENAFGRFFLDVKKPRELLVPAATSLTGLVAAPVSPPINHFLCYDVSATKGHRFPKDLHALVADHFTGELGRTFEVRKPERLCSPVTVLRDGTPANGGVSNPEAHLVCYDVKPIAVEAPHAKVYGIWISDEFGENRRVDSRKEKRLCVPSYRMLPIE